MGFRRLVAAALGAWLALNAGPAAALDLDCLTDAKGEIVSWKRSWQADGSDDGVVYTITEARSNTADNPSEITLLLSTQSTAVQPKRVMTVKKQQMVNEICRSGQKTVSKLLRGGQLNRKTLSESDDSDKQAARSPAKNPAAPLFITYVENKGWVRGEKPALGQFSSCTVGGLNFVCLEDERARFGDRLADIETDIKIYDQLR